MRPELQEWRGRQTLRRRFRTRFVAPALPRRALIFTDLVVVEHGPDERGHVGLVVALTLLEFPLVSGREYGRFGESVPLHRASIISSVSAPCRSAACAASRCGISAAARPVL